MPDKEWRPAPEQWPNPYRNPQTIQEQFRNEAFEMGASTMLSARDKWWIEKMEKFLRDYYGLSAGNFARKYPELNLDWETEKIFLTYIKSLKKEISHE